MFHVKRFGIACASFPPRKRDGGLRYGIPQLHRKQAFDGWGLVRRAAWENLVALGTCRVALRFVSAAQARAEVRKGRGAMNRNGVIHFGF